jgi:plastocyanin domain-containing protein
MAFRLPIAALAALTIALGCNKDEARGAAPTAPAVPSASTSPAGVTTYPITVDGKGFAPSSVEVKQGSHTQLTFTRTTDDTCATQVVFPELKITKDLPLNKPTVIDVPTDAARTLTFQCGMGMFKSRVLVK